MNPTKLPDSIPNLGLKPVQTAGARKSGGDFASQFLALLFEQQGDFAGAESRLLMRSEKGSRSAVPSSTEPMRPAIPGRKRGEVAEAGSADAAPVPHAAAGLVVPPASPKGEESVQSLSLVTSAAVRREIAAAPTSPDRRADPAAARGLEGRTAPGVGLHSASLPEQAAESQGIAPFSRENVEGSRGRPLQSRSQGDRLNPVTAESGSAGLRLSQPTAATNLASSPAMPDVPASIALTAADAPAAKMPAPRVPAGGKVPPISRVPQAAGVRPAGDPPEIAGRGGGAARFGGRIQVGPGGAPSPEARETAGGSRGSSEHLTTPSVQTYATNGAAPERLATNEPSGATEQGIRQPVPGGQVQVERIDPSGRTTGRTTSPRRSGAVVTVTLPAGRRRTQQRAELDPFKVGPEPLSHDRPREHPKSGHTGHGTKVISYGTPVRGPEAPEGLQSRTAAVTGGEAGSDPSRVRRTEPALVERSAADQTVAAGRISRREDHPVSGSGARSNGAAPVPAELMTGDPLKSAAARSVAAPRAPELPAMVFDPLVERFRLEQMPSSTRFIVQLRPEHLGRVEIETRQEGEILTAVIRAENPQTRQSLEAGLDALLERLEEAGIEVHRAEVTDFQSGDNPNPENGGPGAGRRNRRISTNRAPAVKEAAAETAEEVPGRTGGVSYFA